MEEKRMEGECIAFQMQDEKEAWKHMKYKIIKDYGDYANGHWLHTWDDGKRYLARCQNCGGYILIQDSEFHGSEDSYYTDYFPVSGAEEAEKLNQLYGGAEIELKFPKKYLMLTNRNLNWNPGREVIEKFKDK